MLDYLAIVIAVIIAILWFMLAKRDGVSNFTNLTTSYFVFFLFLMIFFPLGKVFMNNPLGLSVIFVAFFLMLFQVAGYLLVRNWIENRNLSAKYKIN